MVDSRFTEQVDILPDTVEWLSENTAIYVEE